MSEPTWNPMSQQYVEPKPLTLAGFLLQRIAEDEAVARRVVDTPGQAEKWWEVRRSSATAGLFDVAARSRPWIMAYGMDPDTAAHIARNDPARVLAECEAKRLVVAEHHSPDRSDPCDAHDADFNTIPCDTLRYLALPYADHPDYDEAWRP